MSLLIFGLNSKKYDTSDVERSVSCMDLKYTLSVDSKRIRFLIEINDGLDADEDLPPRFLKKYFNDLASAAGAKKWDCSLKYGTKALLYIFKNCDFLSDICKNCDNDRSHLLNHLSQFYNRYRYDLAESAVSPKQAVELFRSEMLVHKSSVVIRKLLKLSDMINRYEAEHYKETTEIEYLLKSASNKLLHAPMVNIKKMVKECDNKADVTKLLKTVETLFSLNDITLKDGCDE